MTEQVDLPFASKVITRYGEDVGVVHACGHDNHVAILMGVARVLAGMRDTLPGTVKFLFQSAEEGITGDEAYGAKLMLTEGAFEEPAPEVVFGLQTIVSRQLDATVTRNDPALYRRMAPTLERVAGEGFVEAARITGAEDFSHFANAVPGLFLGLGVAPDDPALVHPNHSPRFYADERALPIGVRALTALTLDYMSGQ